MKRYILLGPMIFLLAWWLVCALRLASPLLIPSPLQVARAFFELTFISGEIWVDCTVTVRRMLIGLFLSALIGIPAGILMGSFPRFSRSVEFLLDFFRSIPAIALFPLFLLVMGIGDGSKLALVTYGCSLIIIVNTSYGVSHAPRLRRLVGRVFGMKRGAVLWKIVLPDALPQIVVGLRTALSLALVLVVVSEMFFGTSRGLGHRIYEYHLVFDVPEMYAAIAWAGILGYTFNKLFMVAERRFVHWTGR